MQFRKTVFSFAYIDNFNSKNKMFPYLTNTNHMTETKSFSYFEIFVGMDLVHDNEISIHVYFIHNKYTQYEGNFENIFHNFTQEAKFHWMKLKSYRYSNFQMMEHFRRGVLNLYKPGCQCLPTLPSHTLPSRRPILTSLPPDLCSNGIMLNFLAAFRYMQ